MYLQYPVIFGANFAFPFIYGPIFYIYTKIVTGNEEKFNVKYLLHFIPFLLAHFYVSPYYLLSHQEKLLKIDFYLNNVQPDFVFIGFFKPVSGIVYTVLSLRLIKNFDNKLKEAFSNIEKIKLDWLRFLISGTFVVWFVVACLFIVSAIFGLDKGPYDGIIYFFVSIFIYAIGYGALNQPQVFNFKEDHKTIEATPSADETVKSVKYVKSSLGEDDIQKIKSDLILLMEDEKLYRNAEITLTQLAEKLLVTNHNLSEVINTAFNKNFYDFINNYRVEEVKEKLLNPDYSSRNLLTIAFESGFSSKSSFNTIFKKHTNTTPSEFRRQALI